MNKVTLTLDDIKALREHAARIGTLDRWVDMIIEWAEAADAEIARLKKELDDKKEAL